MVRDSSNFIKAAEAHRAKVKKMTPAQKQVYMKKRNEKSAAKRKAIQGDLVWPVNRVRRDMSKSFKKRPSREAAIYMAAVAEYCVAELLEISGDQTQKDKKKRISPRAIFKAVTADAEFSKFLKGVQIAKSGSAEKEIPVFLRTNNVPKKDWGNAV